VNATQNDPPVTSLAQPPAAPYALAAPNFRFRALASLAGHAPLGGAREVVLAIYLVARLVDDCRSTRALSYAVRAARASAARSWLANTALPTGIRTTLARLAAATEGELSGVSTALAAAIQTTTPFLDTAARLELERLARAIGP
jgi:hypothetical protein